MTLPDWSIAHFAGQAPLLAEFKTEPEDFVVNEVFAEPWSGVGEHLMLKIVKRDITTAAIARQLESHYGVKAVAIGFAGQKDRRGVCTQWFSVHTVQDRPPPLLEKAQTLEVDRHRSKLRRGSHACNRFEVRLRSVSDVPALAGRLKLVLCSGAPNYFGEQRFGGDNFARASAWLGTRKRLSPFTKGLYLSTLRSFLFNEVLDARVRKGCWSTQIEGDVCEGDLPTGPLWGRGRTRTRDEALAIETRALEPHYQLCHDLEYAGVSQARRAFKLVPVNLAWEIDGPDLLVRCDLPPGGYMTVLLRETCMLQSHG